MKYNGKYSLKNGLYEALHEQAPADTEVPDRSIGIDSVKTIAYGLDSGLGDGSKGQAVRHSSGAYYLWVQNALQTSEEDIVNGFSAALANHLQIDVNEITYEAVRPYGDYLSAGETRTNPSGSYQLHSYNWPGGAVSFVFRYRRTATGAPTQIGDGGRNYEDDLRANLLASLGSTDIQSIEGDLRFDIGFKCGDKLVAIELKDSVAGAKSPSKSGVGWDGTNFIPPADSDEAIVAALNGFAADQSVVKRVHAFLRTLRITKIYPNKGTVPVSWGAETAKVRSFVSKNYGARTPSGALTTPAKRIKEFVNKTGTGKITFKSFGSTDTMPASFLNDVYSNKGVQYIQITNYGLYRLGEDDPLELGVDELSGLTLDTALRFRTSGTKSTFRIEAQINFQGLTASSFDLDTQADNKLFTDRLKRLCGVNESKLFEWAVK
jgi:hypothetical protein